MSDLNSVVTSKKLDGSWQSVHVPSGKISHGMSAQDSEDEMRKLLGMGDEGKFAEPLTSDQFSGDALDIAIFLEREISDMLALHSGFARLESYENGLVYVRLGGGCSGCPSSTITLMNGVKEMLLEKFGEEKIVDIIPA